MSAESNATSGGVSFFGVALVLTTIFAVFKLTGVVDWTWLTVFIPLLIWLGLCVVGTVISVIVFIVVALVTVFGGGR